MPEFTLNVNEREYTVDAPENTALLWVLREWIGLTGTKYSCGIGACGACTVHRDGEPIRACITPAESVEGHAITTIEGLSPDGTHPVQQAFLENNVPQCGYCQPGQIMRAAALLANNPAPTEIEIDAAMSEILCRCGTYLRIRRAIKQAAQASGGDA